MFAVANSFSAIPYYLDLLEEVMLCRRGAKLLHQFERMVQARSEARDRVLMVTEPLEMLEELLFAAKLSYSEAFVAWVTHRGGCTKCRTASIKDDLMQFSSV